MGLDELLEAVGVGSEVILPSQLGRVREAVPEMVLVAAVLEDAIRTYLRAGGKRREVVVYETREWIEDESMEPFSFLWSCDVLGLEAGILRTRLAAGLVRISSRAKRG